MAIDFDVAKLTNDLEEFEMKLESIDVDSVKQRTLKRTAERAAQTVRQLVFESKIKSPANKISPYESGDGPPLATGEAWQVIPDGDQYFIRPHPKVEQRAYVLNFGYNGRIYPEDHEVLRFTVDGQPVFAPSVEGPDAVGYWQAAFKRLEGSDKLQEIAEDELRIEFEEKGL
jgi:hypothetical protein